MQFETSISKMFHDFLLHGETQGFGLPCSSLSVRFRWKWKVQKVALQPHLIVMSSIIFDICIVVEKRYPHTTNDSVPRHRPPKICEEHSCAISTISNLCVIEKMYPYTRIGLVLEGAISHSHHSELEQVLVLFQAGVLEVRGGGIIWLYKFGNNEPGPTCTAHWWGPKFFQFPQTQFYY